MKIRKTRKTIDGKINRYSDWLKAVQTEADRVGMTDAVREQVTNPMLEDGWLKHEFPAHFVASVLELFSDDCEALRDHEASVLSGPPME